MDNIFRLIIQEKDNFDINEALKQIINIYNNTTHSVIKMEPSRAIKVFNKKIINRIIQNTIKSQVRINLNFIEIKKNSKGLLCKNFVKKGLILKEKKR